MFSLKIKISIKFSLSRIHASDRSLFNLPVQATGADGFKLALNRISEKLNGLDARIVHTQHDEIIVEARDDIADQVQKILEVIIISLKTFFDLSFMPYEMV